jgi:hypothetical protein
MLQEAVGNPLSHIEFLELVIQDELLIIQVPTSSCGVSFSSGHRSERPRLVTCRHHGPKQVNYLEITEKISRGTEQLVAGFNQHIDSM